MKSHVIRRARPLLGTFVEIAAWGQEEAMLRHAVHCAFRTIERLQSQLSVHDAASEVSRLNRDANAGPVTVSSDTWRVLRAAARLSRQSGGAFDVTATRARASGRRRHRAGGFRDIEFLAGRRVHFARPLRIDLGGIAKGYCVDRAVSELRRCGVKAGLVNAGGDLRAFGVRSFALHLRHPADPGQLVSWRSIRNAAVATSASYATGRRRCAGLLVDGRSGVRIGPGISVTVRASSALVADALTKVVATTGAQAAPILARYRARAWVLTVVGVVAGGLREKSCAAAA